MSISTNPAPARTDVPLASSPATAEASAASAAATDRTVRRAGIMVAAGTLSWVTGLALVGNTPESSIGITIGDLSALPFQIGLFALVGAQLKTRATGVSKIARGMLRVEYVLLTLATVWTVLHGAVPAFRDDLWLAILDAFWPLSMLGMAIIGVKVAITGRWRGPARGWPMVAESWAPVTVPVFVAVGGTVALVVAIGHLLVGYLALGLILAFRPELTRR
ncbi:hypothetical protein GCM10009557_12550 [Virgisporangium ochraceum]|uniref:Uncharacterized protein n=1 Tax=Virgisporangium ochraceum TaxID=65505 RepID=A0A8J3ZPY0_9ACTN|nr:hypothetical protein [Virgisporangium ochraceum]GIJ65768.1 hypothetical protein Voc01_006850 [Virgisporangium ochraceum]